MHLLYPVDAVPPAVCQNVPVGCQRFQGCAKGSNGAAKGSRGAAKGPRVAVRGSRGLPKGSKGLPEVPLVRHRFQGLQKVPGAPQKVPGVLQKVPGGCQMFQRPAKRYQGAARGSRRLPTSMSSPCPMRHLRTLCALSVPPFCPLPALGTACTLSVAICTLCNLSVSSLPPSHSTVCPPCHPQTVRPAPS